MKLQILVLVWLAVLPSFVVCEHDATHEGTSTTPEPGLQSKDEPNVKEDAVSEVDDGDGDNDDEGDEVYEVYDKRAFDEPAYARPPIRPCDYSGCCGCCGCRGRWWNTK